MAPLSPRVITINLFISLAKLITSSNFFTSINDIISCSLANVISNLFLTNSKKLDLCLSTQNKSDKDIATLLELLIAFSNAFFGSPSSQR